MAAILEMSDGTTTINLIAGKTEQGIHLNSWRPNIPFYKGGGTFQESALSSGRQLIDRQFENHIDTFSLQITGANQDNIILTMQEIRRLLEKAALYWVADWQDEPVWIRAKATDETNARYTIIVSGTIEEDENPYSQPFLQPGCSAVMSGMTLAVEHKFWTPNAPGTGTPSKISAVETYDGRNLGNVNSAGIRTPTSAEEVYVINKRAEANLTDVYVDDGGAFGANLLDAVLPYSLLPAVPVANDAVYFGIDTTVADSGPFTSLVFDLSTIAAGVTLTWQYWNGAWASFFGVVQDNTNDDGDMTGIALNTLGVQSVHWDALTGWVTTTVNGVTGYWVRLLVATAPGPFTVPVQQDRNIYSIIWPYVEIQSAEILGDVSALANLQMENVSDGRPAVGFPSLRGSLVRVGLRSMSRGENFTAYLNCADEQNPTNVTFVIGANVAYVNDISTPCGRFARYSPPGAGVSSVGFVLATPLSQEYIGEYQVYLVGKRTGGVSTDIGIQLEANVSGGIVTHLSNTKYFQGTEEEEVISFGKLNLLSGLLPSSQNILSWVLSLELTAAGAAATADFYHLVLIPVDEWTTQTERTSADTGAPDADIFGRTSDTSTKLLNIDSVSNPKRQIVSYLRFEEFMTVSSFYQNKANGPSMAQSNAKQRLWFFIVRKTLINGSSRVSDTPLSLLVTLATNNRYLSMRGDR